MAQSPLKMFLAMLCLLCLPLVTFCATAGKKSSPGSSQDKMSALWLSNECRKTKANSMRSSLNNCFLRNERDRILISMHLCKDYTRRLMHADEKKSLKILFLSQQSHRIWVYPEIFANFMLFTNLKWLFYHKTFKKGDLSSVNFCKSKVHSNSLRVAKDDNLFEK